MCVKGESRVLNLTKISLFIMPLLLVACTRQPEPQQEQIKNSDPITSTKGFTKKSMASPAINADKKDEIATAPKAVLSLIKRSQQQVKSDNLKGANSSLERAIRITPRYPDSYYYLAKIRYLEGRYTQARALAKKALSLGAQDDLLANILVLLDTIHESEAQ